MNSSLRFVILFAVVALCFTARVQGQTFEYKDGRKLQIEFVQEPPCPLRISVKSVNLNAGPDSQSITLQLENLASKPISAYAMVSGGNRHPNMHTRTFAGARFEPGQKLTHNVWPNSQEHYYFFFDYILFDDGTTCGWDNHRRSTQIESYIQSRASAIARIKELALSYLNPHEIIDALDKAQSAGYFSFDNPGPPNPETIKWAPRLAWAHVIITLRQLKERQKEARKLASQLEKEIPQ